MGALCSPLSWLPIWVPPTHPLSQALHISQRTHSWKGGRSVGTMEDHGQRVALFIHIVRLIFKVNLSLWNLGYCWEKSKNEDSISCTIVFCALFSMCIISHHLKWLHEKSRERRHRKGGSIRRGSEHLKVWPFLGTRLASCKQGGQLALCCSSLPLSRYCS